MSVHAPACSISSPAHLQNLHIPFTALTSFQRLLFCCCPAAMPLEGVPADEWVVFERALIVRDLFTGGTRTFTNSSDARAFRADVYRQYGRRLGSADCVQTQQLNRARLQHQQSQLT
jgi:hypothetical protein